jgi:LacI family transcriptional regulator
MVLFGVKWISTPPDCRQPHPVLLEERGRDCAFSRETGLTANEKTSRINRERCYCDCVYLFMMGRETGGIAAMAGRVTLREVAEQAGLSAKTVSRILNGKNKEVWPSQARRGEEVRRIARDLGFRFNASARATRTGRFNSVGLVIPYSPGSRGATPMALLGGVHDELASRGRHLVLSWLQEKKLTTDGFVPGILEELMVDGLIVHYDTGIPERMIELVGRYRIPSIWVNVKRDADCVHPDDFDAGRRVTEHLLRRGHRRIAYVDYHYHRPEDRHYSKADRYEGYADAMRAAGLAPRLISDAPPLPPGQSRPDHIREWLTAPDRPTAVVAYSALEATPVAYVASRELGIKVPDDLEIAVFLPGTHMHHVHVPLVEVIHPWPAVGRASVDMLLEKIDHPSRRLPPRRVPFRLPGAEA